MRWVSPLFFLIVFVAMQYWVRDTPRQQRTATSQPALVDGGICETISGGVPAGRKSVISLRSDGQVCFFAMWRGNPEEHSYSARWIAPDGRERPGPDLVLTPRGSREFTLSAARILEPTLPLGIWRIELFQDEEPVARYNFRLIE
jgi:hypothetical protein